MTTTATTRNRLAKYATGAKRYTWGAGLNGEVFDLIDESLDGVETIDLTGNLTLSATNYVSDQARNRGLKFTDTGAALSGDVTVTLPSNEKIYWIVNDTGQSVILDAGGTTGTIETGRRKWVSIDASNNVDVGEDGADKEYVDTGLNLKANLAGGNAFTGAQTFDSLLSYNTDLSGSYTDRSLVDKAYVVGLAFDAVDLPGQTGNAGKFLTTDGTNASWATLAVAWSNVSSTPTTLAGYGITDAQPLDSDLTAIAALTTTARGRNELTKPSPAYINNTDSPYAASFGETIFVDCSTGAVEIDLPAATADSLPIRVIDEDGQAANNNITIDPDGSETISGHSTIEIDQARASFEFEPFAGSWRITK